MRSQYCRYYSLILLLFFFALAESLSAQVVLKGKVKDGSTNEPVFSASVLVKGSSKGVSTDFDGVFEIEVASLPVTLQISFIGYITEELLVNSASQNLNVKLGVNEIIISEAAEVVGERISEKQKQAPLTVESMDVIAIKEAPSGSFYEGLGNLKGVDLTSASLGFKVINTRGFNSTSPVRSLQLIDGVDNQSPGLNFSLGNFLGSSDLDVKKVDIVAGASSAFFGPGAFNGVINMETKDPFIFPGLSASVKVGERNLNEYAVRWADYLTNKDNRKTFGYKLNVYYLNADDWEAQNYNPIEGAQDGVTNPYGYDAVNIYGDEATAPNNDFSDDWSPTPGVGNLGLGTIYRNGYREVDLTDYGTENLKLNTGLYYNINDSLQLNYSFNFGYGTTVYQGDNRYRLKDIKFFQHKLEIGQKDKWFVRAYSTKEDAGNTYDIVTTAIRLQDEVATTLDWNTQLSVAWDGDLVRANPRHAEIFDQVINSGLPSSERLAYYQSLINQWILDDYDFFNGLYLDAVNSVNQLDNSDFQPFLEPGTARFTSAFNDITSRKFTDGGSLFFDRSALYHMQGEYKFKPEFADVVVGGNGRLYRPDTQGTIFRDTLTYTYSGELDAEGRKIKIDSTENKITNWEFGMYAGLEKKFLDDAIKTNVTIRLDKNENFDFLVSPAASFVYSKNPNHVYRFSFSSALRNPTLADQYFYYNVGRAILLGNIDGQFEAGSDSLITIDSFVEYRESESLSGGLDKLEYFNVDRIRPERVKTFELGYRGTWFNNTYIDLGYYYSIYTDFIGYNIGLSADFDQATGFPVGGVQVFRVAANARDLVTTQGFNIGANYYYNRITYSANYSWNKLVNGDDDPIIPAFNTPEHKYNLGISGRDMSLGKKIQHFGFGVNYKWIQGFVFEGSPQFTGPIDTYDMIDAQVNVFVPKIHTTFKLGGSNIFGVSPLFDKDIPKGDRWSNAFANENVQVYGGPAVGRLLYFSVLFELAKRQ